MRRNVTRYDARFLGFGWNKVSHSLELHAQGYEFHVLPNAYVVHQPHSPSLDISKYRGSSAYRKYVLPVSFDGYALPLLKYGSQFGMMDVICLRCRCSSVLKSEFVSDLKKRYNFHFKLDV